MAVIIEVSCAVTRVEPKDNRSFGLEEMYALLGCDMIEIVRLDRIDIEGQPNKIMVVDECGALRGDRELNMVATSISGTPIFGDVLVCNDNQVQ